jgi:hypothetical protein
MEQSNGVSVGLNDLHSPTDVDRLEDETDDANAMQQTQEINTQEVRDECVKNDTVVHPKLPANTESGTVATVVLRWSRFLFLNLKSRPWNSSMVAKFKNL